MGVYAHICARLELAKGAFTDFQGGHGVYLIACRGAMSADWNGAPSHGCSFGSLKRDLLLKKYNKELVMSCRIFPMDRALKTN